MRKACVTLLAAGLAAPAFAQSMQFSAIADGEVGYSTNPFLRPGVSRGALSATASIAPQLLYTTPRSSTTVSGHYTRDTYSNHFGYTDSGTAELLRTDQLSSHFSSNLSARYSTANRDTISDPDLLVDDPLNIGRRTKSMSGSAGLQWQATARDQFSFGGQATHVSYGDNKNAETGAIASAYNQYAVNGGYTHTLDARTTIGGQISVSDVSSRLYPDSRTVQPAFTLKRQLTAIWEVDGHLGVVFSHTGGVFSRSSASLGFGVNLCGNYPLTQVCLAANRNRTASGYGPLRTITSISGQLSHKLTEHSRMSINAEYLQSASGGFTREGLPVPNDSKALVGTIDYDRDLTKRLSAGVDGTTRWREISDRPNSHAYTATVHLRAKLGRI